jgi:phage shock protein C
MPEQEPKTETPRLLRRSRSGRVVAGVCGGLGRYLGVDPVLLRIAFVVLAIAGGGGLLLYVVSWILIPEEGEAEAAAAPPGPSRAGSLELIVGGALLALGVVLLLDLAIPHFGRYVWPIALITTGVAVIVEASRRR